MRQLAIGSAAAALLLSLLLLVQDLVPMQALVAPHNWLAAGALLLAGAACIALASGFGVRPRERLMRVSLGSAFILWGMQQLLDENVVSVVMGDIVILLFILDIGTIIGTSKGPIVGTSKGPVIGTRKTARDSKD